MERVRLRQFLKKKMKEYKDFWNNHGENFESWFQAQPAKKLRKCFQLPRQEVLERLKQQNFNLHQSFGTLLCAGKCVYDHFRTFGFSKDLTSCHYRCLCSLGASSAFQSNGV
jgi:hypothetical protein